MAIKPSALYHALSEDLLPHLPDGFRLGEMWGPEFTPKQVACAVLGRTFFKKLNDGKTTPSGDAKALGRFEESLRRCESWTLSPNTSLDEELLGSFRNCLHNFWFKDGMPLVHSFQDLTDRGRTGPGASLKARGTDMYTKLFASPMTCIRPSLYEFYHRSLQDDPGWSLAETNRSRQYGEFEVVEGNKLSFVPKDDSTSRLIATEPNLNMYFQLGFGELLEDRLKSFFGIDLSVQQEINRELARIGSINDDLVTIDLKDASDSVSLKMLDWALPPSFLSWLKFLRSPKSALGSASYELTMISTMGNGYTFPLESIIFSAAVVTAIQSHYIQVVRPYDTHYLEPSVFQLTGTDVIPKKRVFGTIPDTRGFWGVFGDDLVCHRSVAFRLQRLLTLLGFVVNRDKSFVEGPFRESCGRDYFRGYNVRGVYIETLALMQDRYIAINKLTMWSSRTEISVRRTIRILLDHVKKVFVPLHENPDAGIKVHQGILPRVKYASSGAVMYNRYIVRPTTLTIGDGHISVPRGLKNRFFNAEGLIKAFLRGDISGGRISVRQSDIRYRTKRCITPFWDYVPPTIQSEDWGGFKRWRSAVDDAL